MKIVFFMIFRKFYALNTIDSDFRVFKLIITDVSHCFQNLLNNYYTRHIVIIMRIMYNLHYYYYSPTSEIDLLTFGVGFEPIVL